MAIGAHQTRAAANTDWLTPPELLGMLGEFDLDPCCPPAMPWSTAQRCFTELEDGLSQQWSGRVWLNPPYGGQTVHWIKKLAEHGDGIALVFARTETKIFHPWVWDRAHGLFFPKGRIHFRKLDGSKARDAGGPSVLIAYGWNNFAALASLPRSFGRFVPLKIHQEETPCA